MGIFHHKKVAALRCNNRSCGHRMSIEHAIPTEAFGKHKGRKIASEVTKADLMDMTNWMKIYHNHSKLCKMTGPTYCNKTEHALTSCESKDEFKIIKRKFRSFVVQKKVENPESSYAEILGNADKEYNTNRYATFKTKKCGIDDANELRAMQRAHLESHGETLFDPKYDQKIENRLRTIAYESEFDEQKFVWEHPQFIYFGLVKDLMLIQNSRVSFDGTFDDSNGLKVKQKKIWEQLYIITKLNKNEKGEKAFE